MKTTLKTASLVIASLCFGACASQPTSTSAYDPDFQKQYLLGGATDRNIALQSIRAVDVPNSQGLAAQSGERAAAAIARLNAGERTELSSLSASGIGESASE